MKLDFSALAQPAAKARGQVGTTGTPASTRVCASPLAQPGVGTPGDKPAAVALVADLVVAVPAACPPVSPACPQVTDAEKLNADAVSPASPLVPVEFAQGAAVAPFEREDAAGKSTGAGINTCAGCLHLLRRGTCGKPVAAGLRKAEKGFGIVWPPEGHGAGCPAFIGKMPTAADDRPHRLTNDEADRCHAPCWDDAEIAAFMARQYLFGQRGASAQDAEHLADRLASRDRSDDDRRVCLECRHLRGAGPWRCGNWQAAGVAIRSRDAQLPADLVVQLQRCHGYEDARLPMGVMGDAAPPAPAPEPAPAPSGPTWQELDRAYLAHHSQCTACQCAGRGYGQRCDSGIELWTAYSSINSDLKG